MDFLKDRTRDGRPLRILSIANEYTRECLALVVARRFSAIDVVRMLEKVILVMGAPEYIRCDNGPEFIAITIEAWAKERGIQIVHSAPGSPWENPFSETFHSRLRDECLEREIFGSLEEAQVICEAYKRWYNTKRPHSALKYRTPAEFAAGAGVKTATDVVELQVAGVPA
jgi:transposase InsO family protein